MLRKYVLTFFGGEHKARHNGRDSRETGHISDRRFDGAAGSSPHFRGAPAGGETGDAGTNVHYYFAEGPAEVVGDVLQFTQIPPRARFPVKVAVVAWQHGLPGKVQTATPVTEEFFIQK